VACRSTANGSVTKAALELRGEDGTIHYTATAELGGGVPPTAPRTPAAARSFEAAPWAPAEIYGGPLFHGPDLQVIRELDGVSPEGAAASLACVRDAGWRGEAWLTDAALLDGGLQLARLWGFRLLGEPTLPTRVGSVVTHRSGLFSGEIRCLLTPRGSGGYRTLSDLEFTAADGTLVAEMRDVEMHVVPGGRAATGDRPR
jgi:hypothetical protein